MHLSRFKFIIIGLIFSIITVVSSAQLVINPVNQIKWTNITGSGAPTKTCASTTPPSYGQASFGQLYEDLTNGNLYMCSFAGTLGVGWKQVGSISLSGITSITGTASAGYALIATSSSAASWQSINPMTSVGDIIIGGAAGIRTRLGIGTNGQTLTVVSGVPAWVTGGSSMVWPSLPGLTICSGTPCTSWGTSLGLSGNGNKAVTTTTVGTGGNLLTWDSFGNVVDGGSLQYQFVKNNAGSTFNQQGIVNYISPLIVTDSALNGFTNVSVKPTINDIALWTSGSDSGTGSAYVVSTVNPISSLNSLLLVNLDDSLINWKPVCIKTACDPGGTDAPASTSQTINNVSPSLDGHSMFISETTNTTSTQTNALWVYLAGSCDSCTTITSDFNVYITNGSAASSMEFDSFIFDRTDSVDFMFGTQCNRSLGYWQIANNISPWQTSTAACNLTSGAWHHIVETFHRIPGDTSCTGGMPCEYFDTISVDGVVSVINMSYVSTVLPGGWDSTSGLQFQIDIGATTSATTVSENIEEIYFSEGPVSTSTLTPGSTVNFTPLHSNTIVNPTLKIDTGSPTVITHEDGTPLVVGDIVTTTQTTVRVGVSGYELVNPQIKPYVARIVALWNGSSGTLIDNGNGGSGYQSGSITWPDSVIITGTYYVSCTSTGWPSGSSTGDKFDWTIVGTALSSTTFSYGVGGSEINAARGSTLPSITCMAIQ